MEAAFFDLDKTVIAKASIAAFGRTFYRGGLISRSTVVRALASQFVYLHLGASEQKLARVRESVLELTKGWDQQEVSRLVREALDDIVEPIIYAEALDLIERHQAAGPARLPGVRLARGDRPAPRRSTSGHEVRSPARRWSTPTVGTRARWTSTLTGRSRPTQCAQVAEREGIDLERLLRLHGLLHGCADARSRGPPGRGRTLTGCSPVSPANAAGRSRHSPDRFGCATGCLCRRELPPRPALRSLAVATGAAVVAWRFGQRPRPTT